MSKAAKISLPDPGELKAGILAKDRGSLARAITLVESTRPEHQRLARQLLAELPENLQSQRIGISGPPGVGKSTFLNSWGQNYIRGGHRLAILAVDPSSSLSGGSILGDKTRMEQLSRNPDAFIRPSPSSGSLGGVGRRTRESIRLCEAAGFDTIIVETVGVGQNEIHVRAMVDCFLLLLQPGSGDSLQGIKRGIMELADAYLINKAEGAQREQAEAHRQEIAMALPFLPQHLQDWQPPVHCISALSNIGLERVDEVLQLHREHLQATEGKLSAFRRKQDLAWMKALVDEDLLQNFWNRPEVIGALAEIRKQVLDGRLDPYVAHQRLLKGHGSQENP